MKNRKGILFIIATLVAVLASCSKESIHGDGFSHVANKTRPEVERVATPANRSILILYSAGYNTLSSYLTSDIADLMKGWIPGSRKEENILLIYSHTTAQSGDYQTESEPTLIRARMDEDGNLVKDILVRYPGDTRSATPEQLYRVLDYVRKNFPATSYGMIFSSHATGYLPAGFYGKSEDYIFDDFSGPSYRFGLGKYSKPVPYVELEFDPSLPAVKSIGQDQVGARGNYQSYEIELQDFCNAIPMQMDYILFDACLMGGVEVAYELKDKCSQVGFSQTEVLAEGFDYHNVTSHLIGQDTPDPQAVCEDYFNQYIVQSGTYKSATISLIDCSKMEPLAEICAQMFEKYRLNINNMPAGNVQRYYRGGQHWFYDLQDIIVKAGANQEEIQALQDALDQCVKYKAATESFMGSFDINTYSGLSMYLPSNGTTELDKFYKTLKWNIATSLVK